MQHTPEIVYEAGSGRTYAVLCEEGVRFDLSQQLAERLSAQSRVLLIRCPRVHGEMWRQASDQVRRVIVDRGVRQISIVAFQGAAALAQSMMLSDPRSVRAAVFIDAALRPHPTRWSRLVDWMEQRTPLGLPLRIRASGFDVEPFLQRLRCPVLVVVTAGADDLAPTQSRRMVARMPTAWFVELSGSDLAGELACEITRFQEIPARCPQRRMASASTLEHK